ncbi:FxsA family protein [Halorientalis salina]|uniref:FxsA family protein n=1 Tax=Halorientalis salina TaxID=2932266 RepID=UPI0010AC4DEB|nr:FxsA family protein [Halorientalis salina]
MLRIIALLLLIPLFDVMLLVAVAGWLGAVETVLIVVLTALVGMLLVRAEGRHTLQKIQRKVAQGESPTDELVDGGLLLVSGAMLLTPGLVTDLIGLLLVVPLTRIPVRVATKKWVVNPYIDAKTQGFASGNVYVGGFPGGETPGQGQGQNTGGDTYEMDEDAYDIGPDDGSSGQGDDDRR